MVDKIIIKMLPVLIGQLLKLLTPELAKKMADKLLDTVEDAIRKSENKLDDIFLPVIYVIREAFNVPDNDFDKVAK